MIISGGQILAIDKVKTDSTLSGDGVFKPLGVVSGNVSWSSISGQVPLVSDVSLSALSSTESGSFVVGSALYDSMNTVNNQITQINNNVTSISSIVKDNTPKVAEMSSDGFYILCFGENE